MESEKTLVVYMEDDKKNQRYIISLPFLFIFFFVCSIFLCISSNFNTLLLKDFTDCECAGVLKKDLLKRGNTALIVCDVAIFPLLSHFVLILALWTMKKSQIRAMYFCFNVASIMSFIKSIAQMNRQNVYFCKAIRKI